MSLPGVHIGDKPVLQECARCGEKFPPTEKHRCAKYLQVKELRRILREEVSKALDSHDYDEQLRRSGYTRMDQIQEPKK